MVKQAPSFNLFGLISNLENSLHEKFVDWLTLLNQELFSSKLDQLNSVLSSLILGSSSQDWRIKSCVKVIALIFASNQKRSTQLDLNAFYCLALDSKDLTSDFTLWVQAKSKNDFFYCQYPFLISLGQKIRILEDDAKKQMALGFKQAFELLSLNTANIDPFLSLSIRRSHIVHDSLTQISSKLTELKKKLRISFVDEEGIDAGGLTKEWFLLLVRELFDAKYGMFTYYENNFCWFNSSCSDSLSEFHLVGVVLGLAIYNSTILDIHIPPICFKKLMGDKTRLLNDLSILDPSLAKSLQAILDYDKPDFEDVFDLKFEVPWQSYGEPITVELLKHGFYIPVTQSNKNDYVELYIEYVLDKSISNQFEAFRNGFFQVCGGNSLAIFRWSEIEMVVRGDPHLDIQGLESICVYDNFNANDEAVNFFWTVVKQLSQDKVKMFMRFATGSDRVPSTGIQNMKFKLSCLGDDSEYLPTSHTCFNQVCIYRYKNLEKMKTKLELAIAWSQGFSLK